MTGNHIRRHVIRLSEQEGICQGLGIPQRHNSLRLVDNVY